MAYQVERARPKREHRLAFGIVGFAMMLFAMLLAIAMLVAILTVHLPNGFFMMSNGCKFALTLLAASVALALSASGEMARWIRPSRLGPVTLPSRA